MINTKPFSQQLRLALAALLTIFLTACEPGTELRSQQEAQAPNFLLVISDDQSWLHTSFAGSPVQTPGFDRVARQGVYFDYAYASAPTCTASRSALIAGQDFWRLDGAGLLWGRFSPNQVNVQQTLADNGYAIGHTGKGWGPGRADQGQPAGPSFNSHRTAISSNGAEVIDYAENFREFLDQKEEDQPFSFWLSPSEPHRPFKERNAAGAGIAVPDFLPADPAVEADLANYVAEIERQDQALDQVLNELQERGLADNTIVIVTSDNGMPFPRAKATNYQWGVRVPLAISWGDRLRPHRDPTSVINLADIAPTLLDAAGIERDARITGRSLLPLLTEQSAGSDFSFTVTGFERHIYNARGDGETYPTRAIHQPGLSLIRNFAPDRWPAGAPPEYRDIDESSPTKTLMQRRYQDLLELAVAKRPEWELYDLERDPFQLSNLIDDPEYQERSTELKATMEGYLRASKDPVLSDGVDAFREFEYFGPISPD